MLQARGSKFSSVWREDQLRGLTSNPSLPLRTRTPRPYEARGTSSSSSSPPSSLEASDKELSEALSCTSSENAVAPT